MSISNETINDVLNYIYTSDLSIMYKKVILKKLINHYITEDNKKEIEELIKDEDLYDYIFLNSEKKKQKYYEKSLIQKKQYYLINKDKIKEKNKLYYHEHKDDQKKELDKIKEENIKLKEIINSMK